MTNTDFPLPIFFGPRTTPKRVKVCRIVTFRTFAQHGLIVLTVQTVSFVLNVSNVQFAQIAPNGIFVEVRILRNPTIVPDKGMKFQSFNVSDVQAETLNGFVGRSANHEL